MWVASTTWIVIFLVVGVAAVFLLAWAVSPHLPILAAALLFSLASLAVGVLVGFLFGVPRTLTSARRDDRSLQDQPGSDIRANTNLEQVSDWLTALLIGATLVQLGEVPPAAARLFASLAPALGDTGSSASFAGGIVIYFVVLGFLMGWLNTRLYLGIAMQNADHAAAGELLWRAKVAESKGDMVLAERLRMQADVRVSPISR